MKSKIIRKGQRILFSDFMDMQSFWQDYGHFVVKEIIGYDDFCTEDNLEPIPMEIPEMKIRVIQGQDGKVLLGNNVAYILADEEISIDPAGVENRIDLITATVEEIETDEAVRKFGECLEGSIIWSSELVDLLRVRAVNLHYLKDTEEVPEGHMGVASIPVNTDTVALGEGSFDDIRPMKSLLDLMSHIMSNPMQHEDGSVHNNHINAAAGIALTKIAGREHDNLKQEIDYNFLEQFTFACTYDGEDKLMNFNYDGSVEIDFDFNWTGDLIDDILITLPGGITYTLSLTYSEGLVTGGGMAKNV